jgi:uncharacterized membrane protein
MAKWRVHSLAVAGLLVGALLLFTGLPHVGFPLLVLTTVAELLYSAFTGKQRNDGRR